MARDSFTSIMRFLNFGEDSVNEDDHFGKIRFPINHLNTIVPEIFRPHKKLLFDESMVLRRVRLVFDDNTSKMKDTSMGSIFLNCVPTMALY